ncbi:uncharacterized protein MELLADRAFT_72535 [Melampsora larici-populina 98AG31]|uniref:Secreted protein n=1 Tax=Melampsora larici-populina (strain 98AG31 / pathotype 3-4-7) TaxID=747676 RepID=F4RV94_MELLP|nr:uncharacterized protein MELLADRAFT_72535 [Melampsora larici-populina 98AG31]EGG03708.1 secreted protein [Melampsora larici-populina 98AG31]
MVIFILYFLKLTFHLVRCTQLGKVIDVCEWDNNDVANDACSMKKAFGGSSVFPQVLPDFKPLGSLYVQYGNVVVGGAQQLSPSRVNRPPSLRLELLNQTSSGLNTFLVLGLDFQTQNSSTRLFWLQEELQEDSKTGLLSSARSPLLSYQSPSPSLGSGTHEYVILVYQETGAISTIDVTSTSFNLQEFLTKSNLNGELVAGSFFKSAYDGQKFSAYEGITQTGKGTSSSSSSNVSFTNVSLSPEVATTSATNSTSAPSSHGSPGQTASSTSSDHSCLSFPSTTYMFLLATFVSLIEYS